MINTINLAHGAGGTESQELINIIQDVFKIESEWQNIDNDGATLCLNKYKNDELVFTTDSYTISPIFFPNSDIGKLSICGTCNDLAVMGAKPIGLSLSFVIEEGFLMDDLYKILDSIKQIINKNDIPIVTGDTKVIEKGNIDKIIINVTGIGIRDNSYNLNKSIENGDKIIVSGTIGDHGATILGYRYDYKSKLESDCQLIYNDIRQIYNYIKLAKDPTRGGISSILNEISQKISKKILLYESKIPILPETKTISRILGINPLELACEGRFIAIVSNNDVDAVLSKLPHSHLIGEILEGKGVYSENIIGGIKKIHSPRGKLVPRIC